MTEKDSSDDVVRRQRFSGGPARSFLSSLAADSRIFAADLAVDRAHVVMLTEEGILDDDDATAILSALAEVEEAGHSALPDGEDVHAAIETAVVNRVGDRGGMLHTARSRNDEVATCLRYQLREDLLAAIAATIEAREVLAASAEVHTETIMPGFTHLQPAQPTSVAHFLLSYESALARDTGRLLDAYTRVDQSPLGAAAFAGTPFDIDRARTAELLGFSGVVENAMDAVSTRDFLVETMSAVATLAISLSGLAEDFIVFSNAGFVELSDEYASTSSIMPQKKNPDSLELVRATTGDAVSGLNAVLTVLKGLPRAYNRDLQRAHPPAFEAIERVTDGVDIAAGAVGTADWSESALAVAAGDGFSTATGVADLLTREGMSFRTAHEVVALAGEKQLNTHEDEGDGVDAGTGDGVDYDVLDAAVVEVVGDSLDAYVDRDAVQAVMDPEASVQSRDSYGGPAPAAVTEALEDVRDRISEDVATLESRRVVLVDAAEHRREVVEGYV